MTDKKGFILYNDYWDYISELPLEEKGKLLEAIFDYVRDKKLTEFEGELKICLKIAIKQIDINEENYKLTCQKNKQNILKRWHKNDTTVYDRIRTDTKHSNNDNNNDNDNKQQQELDSFLERMGNRGKVEKGIAYTLKENSWVKVNNISAYLAQVNKQNPIKQTYSEPKVTAQEVLANLEAQKRRAGL